LHHIRLEEVQAFFVSISLWLSYQHMQIAPRILRYGCMNAFLRFRSLTRAKRFYRTSFELWAKRFLHIALSLGASSAGLAQGGRGVI
jgi:hypothetical protein